MQSSIALAQIRASHGHILTSLGSHTLLICLGFSILLCSASFPCTSAWFSHIFLSFTYFITEFYSSQHMIHSNELYLCDFHFISLHEPSWFVHISLDHMLGPLISHISTHLKLVITSLSLALLYFPLLAWVINLCSASFPCSSAWFPLFHHIFTSFLLWTSYVTSTSLFSSLESRERGYWSKGYSLCHLVF
jgi:hypothetical protein